MVKHIVLFRFSPEVNEEKRKTVREVFRDKIMALQQKLDFIRHIEVGFNINEAEKWDICLSATFDTLDDVKAYSKFPDHLAAAGELKKYLSDRSCVDYEI